MKTVMNVAEAKAKLSELIERAERGEDVVIARKGKEAVRLVAANSTGSSKPNRANLFGALEGQSSLNDEALAPEPLDAWSSEQPIFGFERALEFGVAEASRTFDSEG